MPTPSDTLIDTSAALIQQPTSLADWVIVFPVALPIIIGAILVIFRHQTRIQASLAIATLLVTFCFNLALLFRVLDSGPLSMTMGRWLPPFGITFTADILSALMALTSTTVALIGSVYSLSDINTKARRYGFYGFLLLMMGGVNGAFITGDIFNLYVWFEVFLISSFGLLILGSERQQLDGALKYAILNLLGTTLFLAAVAMLYGAFGSLNMADITIKISASSNSVPIATLGSLFLFAFAMKAAAFPLNFWLPSSYHTPRIVTAALFGGILTKIGVYSLLRMFGMLMPDQLALYSVPLAWIAISTMVLGVMGALAQNDLRRTLGFMVISSVGVMIAGLAVGTSEAMSGTILYAIHSILVMTALYLLAGIICKISGSYSLRELGGIYISNRLIAACAFILMLAIIGLPPASGLWPKIILVKTALASDHMTLAMMILLTGFLTMIAFGRIFILAIWRPQPVSSIPGKLDLSACGSLLVILLPIVLIGLYPDPFIELSSKAASGLVDPSAYLNSVFPGGAIR